MMRSRAAYLTIGALGMLLLILLALGVLWWVVTTPAGEGPGAAGAPTVREGAPSPADQPPADLADEEVWLADVDIEAGTVVLPDSTLLDVQAVGHGVRSGGEQLVVDSLEVQATVPFADVATELGGDSVVRPAEDGQASVVRTVEVLGREMTAVATGTVEVVDGLLVVEPRSIDLGGPDLLSRAVAAVVRRFVTIEHPIQGLPENLVLQDVAVQEDGFRADLSGEDVVIVAGQAEISP
ncbi:MAG TPA: LmeA family phospholipid-binding protein [Ornithinimicrobium sp.]|nr:LmeA family phospholipid-binding protein [Ornithinimicrobium sp.]